ncbi:hypothetical protein QMK19_23080 [Streptomyces sp. H10-C2]|uniref:hypothetical protein n=1 Tax=unclassified Streptomyces TaxID=2593676 RepID=UPI0024B87C28|nr:MULTISPECIES: hypothetical protein [unclassified Streptomyces]MDJ0342790.1 hypothetical protein [Streptomyces sp. PH10-H1]MDJ0372468.1 hypothetical protein [Streptomyces sp. H10-C2]
MDTAWRDRVVQDYEISRPASTRLEFGLYTTSLIAWPAVWMDDPTPYGVLRRPGIVDIDQAVHEELMQRLAAHLSDPARAQAVVTRAVGHRERAAATLARAERALTNAPTAKAGTALAEATAAFLPVMSTHIVNWLLPEAQWMSFLARLFDDKDRARACMLALSTPAQTGHLLAAHQDVVEAALAVQGGAELASTSSGLAARIGTLYGAGTPAARAMPYEDPAQIAALVLALADSPDPEAEFRQIALARERTAKLREAWETAALLAAAGDPGAVACVRSIVTILSWACDSEERRKVLRHSYLSVVRRWCLDADRDPAAVTLPDLLTAGAAS